MATYNDGNAPFGSQIITIGLTAYVAEKISYIEPSTIVERRDESGNPAAQVVVPAFGSGSIDLQFATTLTAIPLVGATFTLTRQGGATAGTVGGIISEVGEAYGQLEIKKCSVNFRRRYN